MQHAISQLKPEKMNEENWQYMKKLGKISGTAENAYLYGLSNNFNLF